MTTNDTSSDNIDGGGGQRRKTDAWRLERGASVAADGSVTFSVWAPRRESLAVRVLDADGKTLTELPMSRDDRGVFSASAADARVRAGADYFYVLPDVGTRPDPVSRRQPHGVHGPSRVVDPNAFRWNDADWKGVAQRDLVLYELHTGTFSPEGTFDGIAARLPYLRDLGVTAVEVMPVASFPGPRNWGYDGVFLYAPQESYGGPEGLKRLVDACHAHGLAVILDVVYNHLGPEGNYLPEYGTYFSGRYRTPWGDALNFDDADSDEVRRFFIDNALHWLTEYHVDGLRLDAIHGIFDSGARPILQELADEFHAEAERLGRPAVLIAESDLNDVKVIRPKERGGFGLDAQWSDDFHHALHAVVTGNRLGYFADFGRVAQLGKALTKGFVYDGQHAPHRRRRHGNSAAGESAHRLVTFIQNHDQVANGYQGRRFATVAGADRQKVAAAILLTAPSLPLLFQGEEYAEEAPFDYFTSHSDEELARLVREGRHQEYLHLLEAGAGETAWADPQAEETFQRSKLRWQTLGEEPHAGVLAFYKALLALRREVPTLRNGRQDLTRVWFEEGQRWIVIERGDPTEAPVVCCANFGDEEAKLTVPAAPAGLRWRVAAASRAGLPAPERGAAGEALALPGNSAVVLLAAP